MRNVAACVVAFGLAACVTDVARAAEPFEKVGTYVFLDINRDTPGALIGVRW